MTFPMSLLWTQSGFSKISERSNLGFLLGNICLDRVVDASYSLCVTSYFENRCQQSVGTRIPKLRNRCESRWSDWNKAFQPVPSTPRTAALSMSPFIDFHCIHSVSPIFVPRFILRRPKSCENRLTGTIDSTSQICIKCSLQSTLTTGNIL